MTVAEIVPITGAIVLLGLLGARIRAADAWSRWRCSAPCSVLRRSTGRWRSSSSATSAACRSGFCWPGCCCAWRRSGHLAAALLLPLYYLADATLTLGRRARQWRARLAGASHAFLSARARRRLQRDRGGGARAAGQSRAGGAGADRRRRCRAASCHGGALGAGACIRRLAAGGVRDGKIADAHPGHRRLGLRRTRAGQRPGRARPSRARRHARSPPTSFRAQSRWWRSPISPVRSNGGRCSRDIEAVVHLAGIAHAGSGHRRGGLRPRQPRSDRRPRRAPRRKPASSVSSSSPRSAPRPAPSCDHVLTEDRSAASDRRLWPLQARGRGRRCAPPACRSRSCGRCSSTARA